MVGQGKGYQDPIPEGGASLGAGQGPRFQHTVLVHDFLHQLLLLTT